MQSSFHALGVSQAVADALVARGLTEPFPIQERVLPDALAGRDIVAQSPTGSGKTLAFGIPLVERINTNGKGAAALVLTPTRELAVQVATELTAIGRPRGVRVATVIGGVGIQAQGRAAERAHVVVATPGRLEDLLARRLVRLDAVSVLVLDEVDRMLDVGFRPAVERIVGRMPATRQTMLFSATLDGAVGELAARYTRDPVHVTAPARETTAAPVDHRFLTVRKDDKLDELVQLLGAERELALVFVRTKRGAGRLAERLERRGVRAAALHGDMSQTARTKSLQRFASGAADTLVATDVAARGLDVDRVSVVRQLRSAGRRRHVRAPRRPHRPRRAHRHRHHARPRGRARPRGQDGAQGGRRGRELRAHARAAGPEDRADLRELPPHARPGLLGLRRRPPQRPPVDARGGPAASAAGPPSAR